jgi:hypothetical protein
MAKEMFASDHIAEAVKQVGIETCLVLLCDQARNRAIKYAKKYGDDDGRTEWARNKVSLLRNLY